MARKPQPVSVSHGQNDEFQRLQARWNNFVSDSPLLDGELLENVTPKADGELTLVPHGLKRAPRGFFVVRQRYSGAEEYTMDAGLSISSYTSAFQTYTHGLGAKPTAVQVFLRCTVADNGYSVGTVLVGDYGYDTNSANAYGIAIRMTDDTQFSMRCGNQGVAHTGSTGLTIILTATRWQIIVRAERIRRLQDVASQQTRPDESKYLYLSGWGFTGDDVVDLWVF